MAQAPATYIVVGEDGGHTPIQGKLELSITGAENRLKQQQRRGYIALLTGDKRTGTLTEVQGLNGPEVPFEEVVARFIERNRARGAGNTIFRNIGARH